MPEENSPPPSQPDSSPRRSRPRPRRGPRRFPRPPQQKTEGKDVAPSREPRLQNREDPMLPPAQEEADSTQNPPDATARGSGVPASKEAVRKAVTQVDHIISELKNALTELEEVLDILEQAEIYQNVTDRELESLRQSLRRLHRGRDGPTVQSQGREERERPQSREERLPNREERSEPAEPT